MRRDEPHIHGLTDGIYSGVNLASAEEGLWSNLDCHHMWPFNLPVMITCSMQPGSVRDFHRLHHPPPMWDQWVIVLSQILPPVVTLH